MVIREIVFTATITVAIGVAGFFIGRSSGGHTPNSLSSNAGRRGEITQPARLFDAIRWVESSNNNYAVGDGGVSRGPYQIGRAYWQDAIEYGHVDWDYDIHVWSASHCEQIMLWYWARYGARTLEDCARLHNGGPSMQGTDGYWKKIKELMP